MPELNPLMDEESKKLYDAMVKASKDIYSLKPDTIIIATPHNLRIKGYVGVIATEYVSGELVREGIALKMRLETDRELAEKIWDTSMKSNLPVLHVNYGTDGGDLSSLCLDWGTFIPLWFIKNQYRSHSSNMPKVVLVFPSREVPWDILVQFGEAIRNSSEEIKRRTVFIASADQAHAHSKDGPYGYSKFANVFDKKVLEIIKSNSLEDLLNIDPDIIEAAKPDSFWQMLILTGAWRGSEKKVRYVVYGRPTYYGMLVASFF